MLINTIYRRVFVHFRRRRMKTFYALFSPSPETRVLDIGGTPRTWQGESRAALQKEAQFAVTLVNILPPEIDPADAWRFTGIEGDATALPFADASFDLAFSNSVIEHMTTWERQQAFAREARRVAPKLWIQTPARSFPLEAHLLTPFFQYLPKRTQLRITRNFTLWGLLTRPTPEQVDAMVSDIRLLTYREFKELFPDCRILKERILGITKSYIAARSID